MVAKMKMNQKNVILVQLHTYVISVFAASQDEKKSTIKNNKKLSKFRTAAPPHIQYGSIQLIVIPIPKNY